MRVSTFLLTALWAGLGSGCVIRYGEGTPPAASEAAEAPPMRPVDFGPLERQISELVENSEEVDARNRLELAWSLAENMHDADPAAQHIVKAYLQSVIEVEQRARPVVTPLQTRVLSEGFGGSTEIDSSELAGPEPRPEPVEAPPEVDLLDPMEMEGQPDGEGEVVEPPEDEGPDVSILLSDAARLLKAHKADKAMAALEPCRGLPCWEDVGPSWEKARDAHVFAEKEALAVRFLELRGEPEVEAQRAGLLEIQGELSTLRAAWPDTAHAEDIEAHMARVQKELELLPEE